MTDPQIFLSRRRLKSPRAAAIAGILFAVLYGTGLVLIRISVPVDPMAESAWLQTSSMKVSLALNLMPYAGIAFLWFIGVIRDRLSDLEDRLFATVFLGSGLLFLALTFTGAALAGGLLSIGYSLWVTLIFPIWVLVVSVYFLIQNLREQRQDGLNQI